MASLDQLNERALVLPLIGFLLLTPPILLIFNDENEIWGIPTLYFYAFFIWIFLIILGKLLTNRLIKSELVYAKKTLPISSTSEDEGKQS
ncbi:hypothetical protein [Curvivirga aplysinae]|uniref:hypothetical protein n=1 Tax=Curvivirga aplysinae TaxID=2529852 RepID=UPI0012BD7A3E|nr:hypothetical protein [Curvivirga aplysinae]MTI09756.1 hypothetical protein [Curvivirga aplysinae]